MLTTDQLLEPSLFRESHGKRIFHLSTSLTPQARAAELDAYYKETGKVVGPLHGLPISLKNQVALEGIEMNMDYVGWVGRIAEKSAVLAQLLAKQGAVFYVLTNMSQVSCRKAGIES